MDDGICHEVEPVEAYGMQRRLREALGCDYRSLACCRVLLALLLLWDVFVRWQDMAAFYTDNGLLPTSAVIEFQRASGWDFPSLHYASGSTWYQESLFLAAAAVYIMLLLGWRTRLATVAAWVLVTSLHNRQGMNLNGGDLLVRLVLFWAMFLPWGDVWSVDSLGHGRIRTQAGEWYASKGHVVTSAATFALLVQLGSMYMFSYGLKTGTTWREGSALALALQNEQFLTAFGKWLRSVLFPAAFLAGIGEARMALLPEWMADCGMRLATWATLYLEMAGPLLLCCPLLTQELRIVMVWVLVGLHMGFGMCLNIGLFMVIPMACVSAFLPPLWWNYLLGRVIPVAYGYSRQRLVIYVEDKAGTGMGSLAVRACRPFLLHGWAEVVTEIPPRLYLEMQRRGSLLATRVTDERTGQVATETEGGALAQVLRRCPLLLPLWLTTWVPGVSAMFHAVAGLMLRRAEGEGAGALQAVLTWCLLIFTPMPVRRRKHWKVEEKRRQWVRTVAGVVVAIVVLALAAFCFHWNWASLSEDDMSYTSARVAELLRLDQWWGMFSPNPPFETGWFVIPGMLADGRMVDLMPGSQTPWQAPTYERPAMPSYQYASQRWRKYLMNLHDVDHYDKRVYFGHYLCKAWNWPTGTHHGDDALVTFEILFFGIDLEPDLTRPQAAAQGISLWSHLC